MKIGIAFDLAPTDPALRNEGPDDRFEEFDKPETVEAIAGVIRGEGHEVLLLGDGRDFLTRVLADPPDFVFNIAEGEGVGRSREARVPAFLEMLGIPYSGSDPMTLSASLDKVMAKRLVQTGSDVRFPRGWTLSADPAEGGAAILGLLFDDSDAVGRRGDADEMPPLILKPTIEGSSKGIRGKCLARDVDEAVAIYEELATSYAQPILAEEFIAGDEVTVGLIGNNLGNRGGNSYVIGSMLIKPRHPDEAFIYSLEVKRDYKNRVVYETPPDLSDPILAALTLAALDVSTALQCRDLARIDFRVRDGIPYFIEANPLPGLAPETSDLVILAQGYGIEYPDLIRRVLHAALMRVGLK